MIHVSIDSTANRIEQSIIKERIAYCLQFFRSTRVELSRAAYLHTLCNNVRRQWHFLAVVALFKTHKIHYWIKNVFASVIMIKRGTHAKQCVGFRISDWNFNGRVRIMQQIAHGWVQEEEIKRKKKWNENSAKRAYNTRFSSNKMRTLHCYFNFSRWTKKSTSSAKTATTK